MSPRKGRRPTAGAMRLREWAFPAPPVRREVVRAEPDARPAPSRSQTEDGRRALGEDAPVQRPPLLFVHGLAHAAWCWEEWLPAAADAGWSAHALSLRAHGRSEGRERFARIRLAEYEHDVLQEASRLPRPPVVVAHSLGCVVAARVAARYPFAAVVLLAPVPVDHAADMLAHVARHSPTHIARMGVGLPAQLTADDLFRGLAPTDAQRHVHRLDPEPPLVQVQLIARRPPGRPVGSPPVLVYGAEDDALVPRRATDRTARFFGTQVRWLPDSGHDVMLDRDRARVLERVLADLDDVLGAGRPAPAPAHDQVRVGA